MVASGEHYRSFNDFGSESKKATQLSVFVEMAKSSKHDSENLPSDCTFLQNSQTETEIYLEKQKLLFCAVHAVNNLFQAALYSKHDFDEIAKEFAPKAWLNPHKNWLGLGNYDANIVITAIERQGCAVTWWDKRKDINTMELDKYFGIIMNTTSFNILNIWKPKHWTALRRLHGSEKWFHLDSTKLTPQPFETEQDLKVWLTQQMKEKDAELLCVHFPTTRREEQNAEE